jgi:hypothetical protein
MDISGFQKVLSEGANAAKIDLSMTADGALVLWYDWTYNAIFGFRPEVCKTTNPGVDR